MADLSRKTSYVLVLYLLEVGVCEEDVADDVFLAF